jgi:hypothetical protein
MKKPIITALLTALFSLVCLVGASYAAKETTSAAVENEGTAVSMVSTSVVAKVIWVKGAFSSISPDGKSRSLKKESVVYLHETLVTDENSQAQVVFTDDTLMTFHPATKFYIEVYEYKPKEEKSAVRYIMNLIEGGFRTVTGLIAKTNPDSYQINTPVATIGVRGTDYSVVLVNGQLFVGYHQGRPCVSNKEGTICLDDITKYASVPSADSAPVPLSQRPAALNEILTIVPANYTSGGTGVGSSTFPTSGTLSNFCIQ